MAPSTNLEKGKMRHCYRRAFSQIKAADRSIGSQGPPRTPRRLQPPPHAKGRSPMSPAARSAAPPVTTTARRAPMGGRGGPSPVATRQRSITGACHHTAAGRCKTSQGPHQTPWRPQPPTHAERRRAAAEVPVQSRPVVIQGRAHAVSSISAPETGTTATTARRASAGSHRSTSTNATPSREQVASLSPWRARRPQHGQPRAAPEATAPPTTNARRAPAGGRGSPSQSRPVVV